MLLLFLLVTLACGAPLIEELEEEEKLTKEILDDEIVGERLKKLGFLADDEVLNRKKRAVVKPGDMMSDEEVIRRLTQMGYLTNYMTAKELPTQRHRRSISNKMYVEESTVVFDRSFIGRKFNDGRTVLNYLDSFGFLDAALDQAIIDNSMENDGDGISMRATPVNAKNIHAALKLFQEFNNDRDTITGEVSMDDLMIMKLPRCGVPDVHPNYFDSFFDDSPSVGLRFGTYGPSQLDGGKIGDNLVEKGGLKNKLVKLRDDVQRGNAEMTMSLSKRSLDWVAMKQINDSDSNSSDSTLELHKRYDVSDMKWEKATLTYYVGSASTSLKNENTRKELTRAFEVWTDFIPINFIEVGDMWDADIKIKFEKGNHGDKYPFDGSMGVLAHAFYPTNGEVHFDDDEEFTAHSTAGVNLYYTAAHEFGHSLGLKHSRDRTSLMAPYHPGLLQEIKLKDDDIEGITKLYGKGSGVVTSMGNNNVSLKDYDEEPTESENPQIKGRCMKRVDAALMAPDKRSVYLFSEDLFYKLTPDNLGMPFLSKGYPKKISLAWGGVPDNIDAAFSNSSTETAYFFKDSDYWRYDFENGQLFSGYPRKTPKKLPQKLKAIVKVNSDTYFFDNKRVWKHESGSVDDSIKVFKDKEPLIDAAFPFFINGYIVAVKGLHYSVYKARTLKPVPAYTNRPLSWDFGITVCKTDGDKTQEKLITKRMKTMCRAYGMLAGQDYNVNIPNVCYAIGKKFDVKALPPLYYRQEANMDFFAYARDVIIN